MRQEDRGKKEQESRKGSGRKGRDFKWEGDLQYTWGEEENEFLIYEL